MCCFLMLPSGVIQAIMDLMNMRTLTDHKLNRLNEAIDITVLDQPGPGGANHAYRIDVTTDASDPAKIIRTSEVIHFQNGPIGEKGVNGISNEALLAILIDRVRGFQYGRKYQAGTDSPTIESFDEWVRGKFACRDNAIALTLLEDALMRLQKRTRDRLTRGVEGKSIA